MKVGTDAMLLGSLVYFDLPANLLDIGTGTGVLSLMMAQRYPEAAITAIEIDDLAISDARYNFSVAPFQMPIELLHTDFLTFDTTVQFDGILTNPPFFENSFKSHSEERNKARHTDSLPFELLIQKCSRLLSERGIVWIIVPSDNATQLTEYAVAGNLFPREHIQIFGKPGKEVRSILAFGKSTGEFRKKQFTVRDENGNYTEEYITCTIDFHGTDLRKSLPSKS